MLLKNELVLSLIKPTFRYRTLKKSRLPMSLEDLLFSLRQKAVFTVSSSLTFGQPTFLFSNGQREARTPDTRIFSPLLYQLSYLS